MSLRRGSASVGDKTFSERAPAAPSACRCLGRVGDGRSHKAMRQGPLRSGPEPAGGDVPAQALLSASRGTEWTHDFSTIATPICTFGAQNFGV
mmetsp:Transcript_102329/g.176738  ORF Transcript_102329/g.176738 Transcript_102329/m.176738 type:complete len:93 (-) Transcript_102329:450-728(-)